ncbi:MULTISPECIES: sulfatase-like hydrolase/transferase [unclassified Streptomyces]|uniref:sulfatase-like hydrolase/transferase n=1 Tax=unclassified Streptomyces TaxID=2593676 RepID=UPI00225807DE|nr:MULTISPECIES: sulfatase-like hydrolase/transferase [unclassified Streptomyces]WSP58787.1 sulfatase-like hydrolase/transferase [Streptomyces sp. NBC_01241]WSU20700.1 sulfatase-like hydrolase/transferase [Streptomyces sp. NBC_01108]MCX4790505.1 sulfatase-like hydrolase/transferase [Streptomyces sp. NBC_01221]MCX4793768.1 sulfatase-like hydrolase/transferase [Streptomyces sp. NBC_01242]WSJ35185.1 sulfatase-like hydrolase/transferase [Streptomyces sp. NBC_01321]
MTDQHRVDTLGCDGNATISTPALDSLAAEATRFDSFYTPTAICTQARASLFTGQHPFRQGLLVNPERNGGGRDAVEDGSPVLSQPLLAGGCNMGHVGKWHIGRARGPEYYAMDGEHLPGALNPVHHPSYEAWLDTKGYPPLRSQGRGIRLGDERHRPRSPDRRPPPAAARGHRRGLPHRQDPRVAGPLRRRLAHRRQAVHAVLPRVPVLTCPTSSRTSTTTCTTRHRYRCRPPCPKPLPVSPTCSATTPCPIPPDGRWSSRPPAAARW